VRALKHVSFHLNAGEVHALVGENGAGKSTLIRVLTGAVEADAGSVLLEGAVIEENSPHRSRQLGIAAIYQQPAIFPDLTVAENIALVNEPGGLFRRVDWAARRVKARELIEAIGAEIDPDREAGTLSMPEQQLVEIAKALGGNVRVLILDEPTASLTERETEKLFEIIARLRERGVGIVYISHRLEELGRIADRITVLRDGETIDTRPAAEMDTRTLIRLMAGRDLSAVFPKRAVPIGEPVMQVRLPGISFDVRAGEIFGVAGLVGSGRTEMAEMLFGLADGGPHRNPESAIDAGIAYVPEDRRRHGVVGPMPVRANVTLAILNRIARGTLLNQAVERTVAAGCVALGRQSAEGGDCALDRYGAEGFDPRRADAGYRRGGEVGVSSHYVRSRGAGIGDPDDFVGTGRDSGDERPDRRDARWQNSGDYGAGGGQCGVDLRAGAGAWREPVVFGTCGDSRVSSCRERRGCRRMSI